MHLAYLRLRRCRDVKVQLEEHTFDWLKEKVELPSREGTGKESDG